MIIQLTKSRLFTVEPAKRFAKEFDVDDKLWLEIWLRYKLMGYNIQELQEYTHIKVGRRPSAKCIRRWIIRTEIYSMARDVFKVGGSVVVSSYFGKYEQEVINEITRGMRFSGTKKPRIVL